MAWMGRPNWSAKATRTPPRASAIQLGHDSPDTSASFAEYFRLGSRRFFALSSHPAPRACYGERRVPPLRSTRNIFLPALPSGRRGFGKRPAVSIISRSMPSARGAHQRVNVQGWRGPDPSGAVNHRHARRALPRPAIALNGGGAKCVTCRKSSSDFPAVRNWLAQLTDGRGLARAIHAHHQHKLAGAQSRDGSGLANRLHDVGDFFGPVPDLISGTDILRPNRPSARLAVTRPAVSTPMSAEISRSSNCSSMSSTNTRRGGAAPIRPGPREARLRFCGLSSAVPSSRQRNPSPSSGFEEDLKLRSLELL